MSDIAIYVEKLSKKYKIGAAQERHDTLRDWLVSRLRRRSHSAQDETIWALKEVSFEVRRGEVFGIIGRNGAGKSTLLKILSRITEPTSGRAVIDGRVGSLLEVGTGFHRELTGRENIYLSGTILGMNKAEIDRNFDEIVEFSGVEKFIDTPIKRFSSGMMVRLGFSVAAHLEPDILLVDEVLAVGDAAFQKKCIGKMEDVSSTGRTVLFVSHNIGAVNTLCSMAVYLAEGKTKSIGLSRDVTGEYLSDSVLAGKDSLELLRDPGYSKEVRFSQIELATGDGKTVDFGEDLSFILSLISGQAMEGLSIAASIFSFNGICLGTLITKDKLAIKTGEPLRIKLDVKDIKLAPGSYYMGFSVGYGGISSARNDFDVVAGLPTFHVAQTDGEHSPVQSWKPSWGSLVFRNSSISVVE